MSVHLVHELLQHSQYETKDSEIFRGSYMTKKKDDLMKQTGDMKGDLMKKTGDIKADLMKKTGNVKAATKSYMDNRARKKLVSKHITSILENVGGKSELEAFVKITKEMHTQKTKYLFPKDNTTEKFSELAALCSKTGPVFSSFQSKLESIKEVSNPSCVPQETLKELKEVYEGVKELKEFMDKNFKTYESTEVITNLQKLENLALETEKYDSWRQKTLPKQVINGLNEAMEDADVEVLKFVKKELKIPDEVSVEHDSIKDYINKVTIFQYLVGQYMALPTDCTKGTLIDES